LLKAINYNKDAKILDASGGSEAKTALYLAKEGYKVYYSEVDEGYVDEIKKKLKEILGDRYDDKRAVKAFFDELKEHYGKDLFDAIISIMTIHRGDWNDIQKNWKGLVEVLKPNGYLMLVFHRWNNNHSVFRYDAKEVESNTLLEKMIRIFRKKYVEVPSLDQNHEHNKYSFKFKKGINHKWRDEVYHLYTEEEVKELCSINNLKIIFLKTIKMFAKEDPYWYLLAQKR